MTFVVIPRFNMATLITLIEPLRVANYLAPTPLFEWEILSPDGTDIPASNGLSLAAQPLSDRNRRGETLFVLASWGAEHYANRKLDAWLRRQARDGARLGAVELGCYLLARAGLLQGRPVATHWSWAPGFREQFPDIPMVDQLFTTTDPVLTCAGGVAGIDLMLHLITEAHGEGMVAEIADQMLHQPIRPADAPQRLPLAKGQTMTDPMIAKAIALIEANIAEPMTVPRIAKSLGTSQRQLERLFQRHMGCTAVQYGALVRLQYARVLLISTPLSVREVATAAGFNALSHFTVAFGKCFGRRPSDYRHSWPKDQPTPSWPGTLTDFQTQLRQRK